MSSHNWYFADQQKADLFLSTWAQEGWRVEEDGGRFEVYYHTNEQMRLGADGTLYFGPPSGYWFNTREWAELCAKRLNSLDRAFGRAPAGLKLSASGSLGIGTTAPSMSTYMFEIKANAEHVLFQIDQGGKVTRFDLPAFFMAWWRGTTAYRAWRKLMWGEKA